MVSKSSSDKKVYRVATWAAGRISQSAMRAIVKHPQLELVGLYTHSDSKAGRDAGELSGIAPIGVKATRSIDAIIALKPDCVLYMQEGYNADDVSRLLEAGINIVTTRNEFFYAKTMPAKLRQQIEAACEKGKSSIFATGSSPGFITAVLPLALLYMSRQLDCITIDEYADIPASTTADMITKVMGFGTPVPEKINPQMLEHVASGFEGSLAAVAEGLGLKIDKFETTGEFARARKPIPLQNGAVIEAGTMAGQRITISGIRTGKPVLKFRTNWFCSREMDQEWDLPPGNGWRVLIESDTPMDVRISYPRTSESFANQMSGLTAHPAVNSIPYVCDAAPGIRTNVDLPVIIPRLL